MASRGSGIAVIDEQAEENSSTDVEDAGKQQERAREEILVRQCIGGDREAFRPLVDRYSPALHTFVARYVSAGDDARDIVQEAFMRAFRALPDFNPRYRFSTWLYRIALNLCRDHVKRVRTRPAGQPVHLEDERWSVEDPIEEKIDDRRRCEVALAIMLELPAKYREPLILKDVRHMDYKQMAGATGMSVGLLKIRVMRARRKLAGIMRVRGLGPAAGKEGKSR